MKMKVFRNYIPLLSLLLFISLSSFGQDAHPTLADLDDEINKIERYDQAKEESIGKLRKQFLRAVTLEDRLNLSGKLFKAYTCYNIDSAMIYANRKLFYAQALNNQRGIDDAHLNIIEMMVKGGQLKDAADVIATLDKDKLDRSLLFNYFNTLRAYYDGLAEASLQPSLHAEYTGWAEVINDSAITLTQKPDVWLVADQLLSRHQTEKAKNLLLTAYRNTPASSRNIGYIAYSLSRIYGIKAETEKQKQFLIAAAISDIQNSVKEHLALQQLALLLFQEGDTEHAYKYMDQALKDVVFCHARQRALNITEVWPIIQKSYETSNRMFVKWLAIGLVVISTLFIFLLLLVIYVRRKLRELQEIRQQLSTANALLKESNDIKDQYITEFFIQCSAYIDKLDLFRKRALRLFTGGKRNELSTILKTQDVVDEELEEFYARFDTIFLRLFPNFITKFNELLPPNEAILPKQENHLSTDLRIYALIRLGITENEVISAFLRCSKATVYSYRSRIRLKSIDPEHFEIRIMEIKGHA